MYCMKCGAQMPDDVKYCPNCGNEIRDNKAETSSDKMTSGNDENNRWICSNCNHANSSFSKKCSVCGKGIEQRVRKDSNNVLFDEKVGSAKEFGGGAKLWMAFCIIVNIIAIIISVFTKVDRDLRGLMFLSILVSAAVLVGYVGLLRTMKKRYFYIICAAAVFNMGISCIGLEMSIKSSITTLINPMITFLVLICGHYWSEMDN